MNVAFVMCDFRVYCGKWVVLLELHWRKQTLVFVYFREVMVLLLDFSLLKLNSHHRIQHLGFCIQTIQVYPFYGFVCILYVIHDLINEARTLIGLGVSQCWTRVSVWHDNDNYNYMELCNFLKLLLVSTCQCLDYV
jgi:hypothetical protein